MNISTVTAQKGQIGQVNLFFKKDKKIIKNLGYLNAAKYNKYRDSYKTVTSSINFVKNTSANRNNILKANTRTAK